MLKSKMNRFASRAVAIACVAIVLSVLTGCVMIGDRLDQFRKRFYTLPVWVFDNAQGYVAHKAPANLMGDNVNVVIAISGGGARSSYFSANVLEQLSKMPDPSGRKGSVLDRTQVVSGVSGGSLSALYYCLYKPACLTGESGERFFKLYKNHMAVDQILGVIGHIENNLWEGALGYYTRWKTGQTLAQMYDRKIFKGANFGQLHGRALRGEAPLAIASATNLDTGSKFVFSALPSADYFTAAPARVPGNLRTLAGAMAQPVNQVSGFDTIDSEADNFRLSVATAASSGLPALIGATTLVNYKTNGYVHLADGGLNDNTGMDATVQLYLNARARGKGGKLVIIAIDAMGGGALSKSHDRDPDGVVGTIEFAMSVFATGAARTRVYQDSILRTAGSDIKVIDLNLFENQEARDFVLGKGLGLTVTKTDMRILEKAAEEVVQKHAGEIRKAIAN